MEHVRGHNDGRTVGQAVLVRVAFHEFASLKLVQIVQSVDVGLAGLEDGLTREDVWLVGLFVSLASLGSHVSFLVLDVGFVLALSAVLEMSTVLAVLGESRRSCEKER